MGLDPLSSPAVALLRLGFEARKTHLRRKLMSESVIAGRIQAAAHALDPHVCETVGWHSSADTGALYWIDWARSAGWDPRDEITKFADLLRFPHFEGELLRTEPHERFIPRAFLGRPFTIFETSGTTGPPKQRIGWDDYKLDYEKFSETLDETAFPPGGFWLSIGPIGPHRPRIAIQAAKARLRKAFG
jgi:hypothetical protein